MHDLWAAAVGPAELAALPELAGPESYLAWAHDGLAAAHDRIAAAIRGVPPLAQITAERILQAGLDTVPAALAVAAGTDGYLAVQEHLTDIEEEFRPGAWRDQTRGWLARGLAAGEIEACRGWLDMAVRITGILQGLPGEPAMPSPCYVPVPAFQRDIRAFAMAPRVSNPLTTALTTRPGSPARSADGAGPADQDSPFPSRSAEGGGARLLLDQLPGLDTVRAQLTAVIAVAEAEQARQAAGVRVRPGWKNLVFAGGPGTGKSRVAALLAGIYRDLGVLPAGTLTEVTRAGLSSDHAAETARLCEEAFGRAAGGMLLVSDAHLPGPVDAQDRRALRLLTEELTARRDGGLVVILAGPGPAGQPVPRRQPGPGRPVPRHHHLPAVHARRADRDLYPPRGRCRVHPHRRRRRQGRSCDRAGGPRRRNSGRQRPPRRPAPRPGSRAAGPPGHDHQSGSVRAHSAHC